MRPNWGCARAHPHELVFRDNADLVSVCTPLFGHAPPSMAVLQSGKHVLVKKSTATLPEERDAMPAAARLRQCGLGPPESDAADCIEQNTMSPSCQTDGAFGTTGRESRDAAPNPRRGRVAPVTPRAPMPPEVQLHSRPETYRTQQTYIPPPPARGVGPCLAATYRSTYMLHSSQRSKGRYGGS